VALAILYFRADKDFVPLKSADDFDRRLQWDDKHFALIKQWLKVHLPPVEEPQSRP
jgi:hypothetical protein